MKYPKKQIELKHTTKRSFRKSSKFSSEIFKRKDFNSSLCVVTKATEIAGWGNNVL